MEEKDNIIKKDSLNYILIFILLIIPIFLILSVYIKTIYFENITEFTNSNNNVDNIKKNISVENIHNTIEKNRIVNNEIEETNSSEIQEKISAGELLNDLKNSSGKVIGKIVSDGFNGEIPIPEGFFYVGGKVDTGAVISDNVKDKNKYIGKINIGNDLEGNQFVWVPCSTTNESGVVKYCQNKIFNNGTEDEKEFAYSKYIDWEDTATSAKSSNENYASVTKYGGFYIGRYEAGVPSDAVFYANKEGDIYYTASTQPNKNVTTYTPVSKAKNQSWNYISQENAKIVSNNMYKSSLSVRSGLIDSYAWDTVVNWIMLSGRNILDSTTYGNYRN